MVGFTRSLTFSLSLSTSEYNKQQTVVAVTENCNCICNSTAALAPRFVYATYVVSVVVSFVVPVVVYDAFGYERSQPT